MEIVKRYKIKSDSDLLFAKIDLKNFFKRVETQYSDFLIFAVMELGTNIIKYANSGEIWLLKEKNGYILCSLDKGSGIKNLKWALQKGNSTSENSLGLGLYQLKNNDYFDFFIFTSTDVHLHGSVFMLFPKNFDFENYVYFNVNYMGLSVGGDFFANKGKYFLVGDVSGHGLKAYKSVELIKDLFFKYKLSCKKAYEFFSLVHFKLKEKSLRSAVMSLFKIDSSIISVCGVGNIGIMKKDEKIKYLTQKEGIVGEVFSNISQYEIENKKNLIFSVFSDGIDEKVLYNILHKCDNVFMVAVCAVYFSQRKDDKLIFIYKG